MFVSEVQIECGNIRDAASFHDEFGRVFLFPDFYGRNMDAWIGCMSNLDDPGAGMTGIHVEKGKVLMLELVGAKSLRRNYPEQYACIIDSSSLVNRRRIETGQKSVLAIVMGD